MLERIRDDWTIVIVGSWNVGIFNPTWLANHIFESDQVTLEFGVQAGIHRRIIGDNVIIIPAMGRLILAPMEISPPILQRMEEVASRILELLEHTPIISAGINFVYKLHPITDELAGQFPIYQRDRFTEHGTVINSRSYGWKMDYQGQIINLTCDLDDQQLLIKFNFHADTPDARTAREYISGSVLQFRNTTESLLEQVFNINAEEE